MATPPATPALAGLALRGFLYLLLGLLLAELARREATTLDTGIMFSERGRVELAQSLFLAGAVLLSVVKAIVQPAARPLAVSLALGFSVLLIRENDQFLELWLIHGAWKYLAAVPVAALLAWFLWQRRQILAQTLAWSGTTSFGLMLGGFTALVFMRLFGSGKLWSAFVEPPQQAALVKTAVQEGGELICLALMFLATLEYVLARPPSTPE